MIGHPLEEKFKTSAWDILSAIELHRSDNRRAARAAVPHATARHAQTPSTDRTRQNIQGKYESEELPAVRTGVTREGRDWRLRHRNCDGRVRERARPTRTTSRCRGGSPAAASP